MKYLALLLIIFSSYFCYGQQSLTTIAGYNAYVYTPIGYSASKKYPVLIAIPGNGEVGTNAALLNAYLPCKFIASGTLAPNMIVVCVQPPNQWPTLQWLVQIYDSVIKRWSIDLTRVYGTGYSAGATVWDQFATTPIYAKLVAAVFSMSAPPMNSVPLDAPLYRIYAQTGGHFWGLWGSNDNSTGYDIIADTMNSYVKGSAQYTLITGMSHCCWDTYYNPTYTFNGINVYNWLLQYSNASAIAPPPIGNRRISVPAQLGSYPQVYLPNVASTLNPQPGDTLVVPTTMHSVYLQNFTGTPAKPIVIIPQDSGLIGGYSTYAFSITNGSYFKMYGFHIHGKDSSNIALAVSGLSTNYELCNLEVSHAAAQGIVCKENPDSTNPAGNYPVFSINSVSLHDINSHNNANENYYIGYTFDLIKPLAAPLINLKAYNLRSDSSGWDGIQFSNVQALSFHDCSVNNYGITNTSEQQTGVTFGSDVTLADSAYNILINKGTGPGLLCFARGLIKLRNWTLTNCASTTGQSGIYVNDGSDLGYNLPPQQLNLANIMVVGSNQYALDNVDLNGTAIAGTVSISYSAASKGIFDKIDSITVANKTIVLTINLNDGKHFILYTDGSYSLQ